MPEAPVLSSIADILVATTVLAGAIAAAIKYQIFNLFGHRWESKLSCRDQRLKSGKILFVAEYCVENRGQRPLLIKTVTLSLLGVEQMPDSLVVRPDRNQVIALRSIPDGVGIPGNMDVQPGERSIYTLRCYIPDLPEVVFIECKLDLPHQRAAALFIGLHARASSTPSR